MKSFIYLSLSFVFSTVVLAGVPKSAAEAEPLEKGVKTPNPVVRTVVGESISLDKVRAGKPVVLVFYRGSWCPFCMRHLSELQEVKGELEELGWRIVGVSPDKPVNLKAATKKAEVDYGLVSDSDMTAAKAFGVAFQVGNEDLGKLKSFGINLAEASGSSHHMLPVPSVFAVDKEGVIQYVYSNPDYKTRLSGEALVDALKK